MALIFAFASGFGWEVTRSDLSGKRGSSVSFGDPASVSSCCCQGNSEEPLYSFNLGDFSGSVHSLSKAGMDLVDGTVKDVSGVVAPFFCVDAGVEDPSDHSWGKEVRVLEESVDASVDADGNDVNGGEVPGASFSSVAMVQADGNTERVGTWEFRSIPSAMRRASHRQFVSCFFD